MHWMESFTGTTATWVAALISFISVVINIWLPSRHRPQASFTLIKLYPRPLFQKFQEREPDAFMRYMNIHDAYHLQNVGDGAGYNLSISFLNCNGMTTTSTEQDPRDIVTDRVFSTNDDIWVLVEHSSICKSSVLEVHWVTPPTRLNHCCYQRISIPAPPHKWGIANRVCKTGMQWFQHRCWHRRERKGQLSYRPGNQTSATNERNACSRPSGNRQASSCQNSQHAANAKHLQNSTTSKQQDKQSQQPATTQPNPRQAANL